MSEEIKKYLCEITLLDKNDELVPILSKIYCDLYNSKKDLEERIEKAIEYIKENQTRLPIGFDNYTHEKRISDEVVLAKDVLEILEKKEV